jgi:trehalose-phosphatase
MYKNRKEIIIEDKTYSLAFHYRLLPENKVQPLIEHIEDITKKIDQQNQIQLIYGAKVIELRAQGWNKGKAIDLLLNENHSTEDILPIYIGDDTTDEDAFKQIKKQGITIYVKNNDYKKTNAEYFVYNPEEVHFFLQSLNTIQSKKLN